MNLINVKKFICLMLGRHTQKITFTNVIFENNVSIIETDRFNCSFCKDEFKTIKLILRNCSFMDKT